MQKQLGLSPTLTVIQVVVTRWNSTLDMFERFLTLKTPILSTLANSNFEINLTLNDWNTLKQSSSILQRFKEITIELSSKKNVTISKVILFSQALISYCIK